MLANVKAVSTLLGRQADPDADMLDKDAVFVCIDCEAWEFDQKIITEVGVAVLDTRKLKPLPEDAAAAEAACFENMAVAHFLIKENQHRVNKRFIKGFPDNFTFGQSKTIDQADMVLILHRLFQDPVQLDKIETSEFVPPPEGESPRNIVFVGHDTSNDLAFLKTLGFEMRELAQIICTADTQRVLGVKHQMRLQMFAAALDFTSPSDLAGLKFLHNAGNDAAWTLKFLIAMVSQTRTESFLLLSPRSIIIVYLVPHKLTIFGKPGPTRERRTRQHQCRHVGAARNQERAARGQEGRARAGEGAAKDRQGAAQTADKAANIRRGAAPGTSGSCCCCPLDFDRRGILPLLIRLQY